MNVYFLEASEPLTKRYTQVGSTLTKTPYPFVWEFTSYVEPITTLVQLEAALKKHAALGRCLLKGQLTKPLVNTSRAGSTTTGDATEFIVLDLDGLDVPDVNTFLAALDLADVSYIVQWSASYGIQNKLLRAHIFMLLAEAATAPLIKQWLIQKNHEVPMLQGALSLTKTGNSISWPLDISACQNDKLIYIAPPVLKGVKDPMGKKPRIELVKRKHPTLSLPSVSSTEANRELTTQQINQLRETAGLPKRKITYKMHGTTEVMAKPDACTITDQKTERGFVYFNLNGGDSWAYYHPENNADYIYNFKGEPAYLTKELLPDYWAQVHNNVNKNVTSTGRMHLAFLDRATSGYWRGTYDTAKDKLELFAARNETQLRDFAKQVGAPLGDFIPEWDITFDPHNNVRVDPANHTINQFTPTVYMLAKPKPVAAMPKTITKILHHALGGDVPTIDHFVNWLAFILQQRDRTKTAWVLHGVPGTGKGLLSNNILRPIFGSTQTTARRMEELNEPYNHFMRNSFLVLVDEVQTKALQNERSVMAKLKNFITEEMVPIRQMYANAVEVRNYTNWLFFSNMPDPVSIDKEDRRFNVGKYQPAKLVITDKEIKQLESELQAFHDYLMAYPLDLDRARTVLQNQDRTTMISISESSIDTVASAVLEGNFKFFLEQLPTDQTYHADHKTFNRVENYRAALRRILDRTDRSTGGCSVGREELRVLFEYTVGKIPETPNKFTSLLKHHRIHIQAVWVDAKTVNGLKIVWHDVAKWQAYLDIFTPPKPGPKPSVAWNTQANEQNTFMRSGLTTMIDQIKREARRQTKAVQGETKTNNPGYCQLLESLAQQHGFKTFAALQAAAKSVS